MFPPADKSSSGRGEEVPAAHSGSTEERTDQFTGVTETTVSPTQRAAQRGSLQKSVSRYDRIPTESQILLL